MIKVLAVCSVLVVAVTGQLVLQPTQPRIIPGRPQTVLTVSNTGFRPRPAIRNPVQPLQPLQPLDPEDLTPKPYSFAYESTDEQTGANSKREESSDGRTTRGSYSYVDAEGVFRVVEYTADENGFNANIRTNEPGAQAASETRPDPANTVWTVEAPPPAVAARYATAEAAREAAATRRVRRSLL